MGITFKHKIKRQAIFYNDLVPGRSTPGPNGSAGQNGTNGPSIYFSDYTPDDDYVKKILLDKISQGLFLTSDSAQKLVGISYTPGDLIITEKKYVYKLILNNGEYDLKFLGQFVSREQSVEDKGKTDLLDSLINVEINNLRTRAQPLPVPTNRGMESANRLSDNTIIFSRDASNNIVPKAVVTDSCTNAVVNYTYDECLKKSFGFDFYPIIRIEDGSDVAYDYDFYLKIKMKNNKSLQAGVYTLEENDIRNFSSPLSKDPTTYNLYNVFMFYKCSELKLKVYGQTQNPSSSPYSYATKDGFAKCSITEMSCDKLHPSGNNIDSNVVDSHYIYRSGNFQTIPGAINELRVANKDYVSYDSSYWGKPGSVRKFGPIRAKIYEDDKYLFRSSSYYLTLGFLQYSKRKGIHNTLIPNLRGGDSAFFSGIVKQYYDSFMFNTDAGWAYINSYINNTEVSLYASYCNFAHHINCMTHSFQGDNVDSSYYQEQRFLSEQNYVVENWMKPFYFDENNIYELVCVNKKTGETYNMNLRKIVIS